MKSLTRKDAIIWSVRCALLVATVTLVGMILYREYDGPQRMRAHQLELYDDTPPGGLSVLFIGNSHTFVYDIPFVVQRLARADSEAPELYVEMAASPGVPLPFHYTSGSRALALASSRKWDVIVMQNNSAKPWAAEYYKDEFYQATKAFSPHTDRLIFYQTWAWADDHPRFVRGLETHDQMYAKVKDLYEISLKVNREVTGAPVGHVFERVRESLGYRLTQRDATHLNAAGALVSSCVLFRTIANRPCPKTTDLIEIRLPDEVSSSIVDAVNEE